MMNANQQYRPSRMSAIRRVGKIASEAGYSLIEVCFAAALLALFSAGVTALHSQVLGILRNCRDDISASQALQQRVEQMRISNWAQVTDANYIATSLRDLPMPSILGLTSPKETITITPYPAKTNVTPIQVARQQNNVQVVSTNSGLKNESIVQIDIRLVWKGFPRERSRIRGTTVLVAQGGIAK